MYMCADADTDTANGYGYGYGKSNRHVRGHSKVRLPPNRSKRQSISRQTAPYPPANHGTPNNNGGINKAVFGAGAFSLSLDIWYKMNTFIVIEEPVVLSPNRRKHRRTPENHKRAKGKQMLHSGGG